MSDISKMYTFVENKEKSWQAIGLTKDAGKYQGVLDSNGLPKELMGEDFFNLIGDVLYDILDQQLKDGNLQYVNTDN